MTTKINSKKELEDLVSNKDLVLVDFWATWCPPCRMMNPILESISTEMFDKVTVAKVDVDQNQALSAEFGITSIPTMVVFKNGKVFGNEIIGAVPKPGLVQYLEKVSELQVSES